MSNEAHESLLAELKEDKEENIRRFNLFLSQFIAAHGRQPNAEEIQEFLGLEAAALEELLLAVADSLISADVLSTEGNNNALLLDLLSDPEFIREDTEMAQIPERRGPYTWDQACEVWVAISRDHNFKKLGLSDPPRPNEFKELVKKEAGGFISYAKSSQIRGNFLGFLQNNASCVVAFADKLAMLDWTPELIDQIKGGGIPEFPSDSPVQLRSDKGQSGGAAGHDAPDPSPGDPTDSKPKNDDVFDSKGDDVTGPARERNPDDWPEAVRGWVRISLAQSYDRLGIENKPGAFADFVKEQGEALIVTVRQRTGGQGGRFIESVMKFRNVISLFDSELEALNLSASQKMAVRNSGGKKVPEMPILEPVKQADSASPTEAAPARIPATEDTGGQAGGDFFRPSSLPVLFEASQENGRVEQARRMLAEEREALFLILEERQTLERALRLINGKSGLPAAFDSIESQKNPAAASAKSSPTHQVTTWFLQQVRLLERFLEEEN